VVRGTGVQIATSSYHSYNHGLVFTGRIVFLNSLNVSGALDLVFLGLISLLGSYGLSSLLSIDGLLPDKRSFEPAPFWRAPR